MTTSCDWVAKGSCLAFYKGVELSLLKHHKISQGTIQVNGSGSWVALECLPASKYFSRGILDWCW